METLSLWLGPPFLYGRAFGSNNAAPFKSCGLHSHLLRGSTWQYITGYSAFDWVTSRTGIKLVLGILVIEIRWRANVHYAQYASIRRQISVNLLQAMPCYGAALLQVSRLCQEILSLQLLPVNTRFEVFHT